MQRDFNVIIYYFKVDADLGKFRAINIKFIFFLS